MNARDIDAFKSLTPDVLIRDNVGYDFVSMKTALMGYRNTLMGYDEVVIANDSAYAPFGDFADVFLKMNADLRIDFWGLTSNHEFIYHLQSYFLVFKNKVVSSEAFWSFWETVQPQDKKESIILNYEVGLTQKLQNAGFFGQAFFEPSYCSRLLLAIWSAARGRSIYKLLKALVLPKVNFTIVAPLKLLNEGVPMVKREVLRSNPARLDLGDLKQALLALNSDLAKKIPELDKI